MTESSAENVLTFVDAMGIHEYIYASNRLRDIIGGSWLVDRATAKTGWIHELGFGDYILVAAGGNAVLRFAGSGRHRDFAAALSRRVLDDAPGLRVAIHHQPYDAGGLGQALVDGMTELAKAKAAYRGSAPLLGLGVTAACAQTRLPASEIDVDRGVPISAGLAVRRRVVDEAEKFWHGFLPQENELGFAPVFPSDLDELGRSRDEVSLIGVVYVDLNEVGSKLNEKLTQLDDGRACDEEVASEFGNLSLRLDTCVQDAMRTVLHRVCGAIDISLPGIPGGYSVPDIDLRSEQRVHLPFRPIFAGGDDLTFLCDGRIALDLAATALESIQQSGYEACAGVAIVKAHAPFARSYALAKSLCASAKRKAHDANGKSAIDWHISLNAPGEALEDLRQRQYSSGRFHLTARPYVLDDSGPGWSWRSFRDEILGPDGNGLRSGDSGANWLAHRSKLKELREVLRDDPGRIGDLLTSWKVAARDLGFPKPCSDGFVGAATPLLDAIELLDLHLPLDPPRLSIEEDQG